MGRRLALGELRVRSATNSPGHYVIERRGRGEGGRGGGGQGRPAAPARLAQRRGWGWSACFNPCKAAPLSLCSLVTVPKEGGLGRTRPRWKTHAHSAEVGLGGGTRAHPALDPPPARSRGDPGRSGRAHGARGRDAQAGGEMLQGGALRPHAAHLRPAAAGTAVPAARRARPPSLSASAARPGPARLRSAPPAPPLGQIRMRRRCRRRASPARAAAALGAPPGPPPDRGPRRPGRRQRWPPRGHTPCHGVSQTAALAGARGGVTRSHTPTGSHTPTLGHIQRHEHHPHAHTHTESPPHMGSHRVKHSDSHAVTHMLTLGPTRAQRPVASHTVTHSDSATITHMVSHTSTHMSRHCHTLPWGHKEYTHASYTASQSHSVTHFYTLKFVTSVTHSHGGHTSCTVTHSYITQSEEVTTSMSTTVTTTATHSMGSPCHTSLHDTCGVTLSQSKRITHSRITDFTHVPHHVPPVSRMHPASQTDTVSPQGHARTASMLARRGVTQSHSVTRCYTQNGAWCHSQSYSPSGLLSVTQGPVDT